MAHEVRAQHRAVHRGRGDVLGLGGQVEPLHQARGRAQRQDRQRRQVGDRAALGQVVGAGAGGGGEAAHHARDDRVDLLVRVGGEHDAGVAVLHCRVDLPGRGGLDGAHVGAEPLQFVDQMQRLSARPGVGAVRLDKGQHDYVHRPHRTV